MHVPLMQDKQDMRLLVHALDLYSTGFFLTTQVAATTADDGTEGTRGDPARRVASSTPSDGIC